MNGLFTRRRPPSGPEGGRRRRTGRPIAVAALALGMALVGAGATALVTAPRPAKKPADIGTLPITQGAGDPAASAGPAAAATRLRVNAIGLDTPLTELQVQPDGHLAAPEDPDQVGWWSQGPRPGDPGAVIFVGHLDSPAGPAAFSNVSSLRPGDTITVDRSDHSHVTFTVKALRQYDKDSFPDEQVYTTAGAPALRLITCGGPYDSATGGYRDNVVVYATLRGRSPGPGSGPHHDAKSHDENQK